MIEIKVDTDNITVDDFILMQEAAEPGNKVKMVNIRDFIARFVDGVDFEEAKKQVGALTFKQMLETIEQIGNKFEEEQNPPASGGQ